MKGFWKLTVGMLIVGALILQSQYTGAKSLVSYADWGDPMGMKVITVALEIVHSNVEQTDSLS